MANDKEEKKADKKADKAEFVTPTYTGAGFIPVEDLVDIVQAWQQRKVLCEDVDLLERKGGMSFRTNLRNGLDLQRP